MFLKVIAQNFDDTVFDTDDLSITRGSSLTLLEAPRLVAAHLAETFPDVDFEAVFASASELLLRCSRREKKDEAVGMAPARLNRPKGIPRKKWTRATRRRANELGQGFSQEDAVAAGQAFLEDLDLEAGRPFSVEEAAGHILHAALGGGGPAPLSEEELKELEKEAHSFLAEPRGEVDGEKRYWPFDLFIFAAAGGAQGAKDTLADVLARIDTDLAKRQLQRLTCPVPPPPDGIRDAPEAVCRFTGVLASGETREKGLPTSPSAARRRKVGREQKRRFYERVLEEAAVAAAVLDRTGFDHGAEAVLDEAPNRIAQARALLDAGGAIEDFANDFEMLVKNPPSDVSKSVQAGMCVIALDGNGFGARRLEHLRSGPERYRAFSGHLDVLKAALLADVLTWLANTSGAMIAVDGKKTARFETILWGGDEFGFVAPAWIGWRLVGVIHEALARWSDPFSGERLHVSTGVVFAPHDAPIRDVRQAADALCTAAKHDRGRSLVQAIAYEGVDRVHMAPAAYRADWLGADVNTCAFSVPATKLACLPETTKAILGSVGRSLVSRWYFRNAKSLGAECGEPEVKAAQVDMKKESKRKSRRKDAFETLKESAFPDGGGTYPLLPLAQMNMLLDYLAAGEDVA